jgi:uncharacterized protein (DUF2062 family)
LKKLRELAISLAGVSDTPERTAFAFSLGVFWGFSPFLGFHTALAIVSAFLFRLNRVAMLMGTWSNVPWLVPPYYAFATWIGVLILGLPEGASLPKAGFSDLISSEFWLWVAGQWRLLIPAFVGSALLSTLFSVVSYPAALSLVRRYRRSETS